MREVPVPTGFAAHSRRRALALTAAWLIVLQAFLAGIATAQAGAASATDSIEAICHGSGTPSDPATPDRAKVWHLCCVACTSAAAATAPPAAPAVAALERRRSSLPSAYSPFIVVISPGAIRAGPSRAPPARA
jgi:hypothetical protein